MDEVEVELGSTEFFDDTLIPLVSIDRTLDPRNTLEKRSAQQFQLTEHLKARQIDFISTEQSLADQSYQTPIELEDGETFDAIILRLQQNPGRPSDADQ